MGLKIAVRMPNWLGDFVMASAVLSELREGLPDAYIAAVAKAPLEKLLEKDPRVDAVFRFEKRQAKELVAWYRDFDAVLLLTNSFSSAWQAFLSGVPQRIGYRKHFRSLLLKGGLSLGEGHQVDLYRKLSEPFLTPKNLAPSFTKKPRLELLQKVGYKGNVPLIGINPGAAYGSAKCWPKERFALLAKRLEKEGCFVVFLGDAGAIPLIDSICQGLPAKVVSLAGKTDLQELLGVISCLDILVTNDSGPMHLADALGIKVVALFGSTDPDKTGPYRQPQAALRKKVVCSPCFQRTCPLDFACMRGIKVEEVFRKVLSYV